MIRLPAPALFVIAAAAGLVGCAPVSVWHPDGTPVARLASDLTDCRIEAGKRVPPDIRRRYVPSYYAASYARFWVTRLDQAARFSLSFAATPSVNVTPRVTEGNWFAPFSRRQVFAAA